MELSPPTDHEFLPSGRAMIMRDIKKALNGEPFIFYPVGEKKGVKVPGMNEENCYSYFTLFHNYKNFGLPHGEGFLNELPWVIDFLRFMNELTITIENWRLNRSNGNSNLTPKEAGF